MKITEIIIACFNMDGILTFYTNVFDMSFQKVQIPEGAIFAGNIDGIKAMLCPAEIAGIEAKDNRHQLTFLIDDISIVLDKVTRYNGNILKKTEKAEQFLRASIKDVDGNSIILKSQIA